MADLNMMVVAFTVCIDEAGEDTVTREKCHWRRAHEEHVARSLKKGSSRMMVE